MHLDLVEIITAIVSALIWLGGQIVMIKIMRRDLNGLGKKMGRMEISMAKLEGYLEAKNDHDSI
jgi:hypothetical protein